jgi:hypothetical protein
LEKIKVSVVMKAGMRARFPVLGAWSLDDDFGRLIEERGELIRPIRCV